MDDYVSLTSYTHHPFYTQFAIEIQDNWRNGLSWNLPLDEFMAVMDNAVKKGYTFAWGSDVSEQGFTRDGIAVMPDAAKGAELTGSDMARWTGLVKNSWGESGKYKGIWYASKAFVAYKTMNILVHKDALPKDIAKKLGIK